MQTATGGAEHSVKRIHDYLDRLRQRGVTVALGLVARRPQVFDNLRQDVFVFVKACTRITSTKRLVGQSPLVKITIQNPPKAF